MASDPAQQVQVRVGQVLAILVPDQADACRWETNDLSGTILQPLAAGFDADARAYRFLFRAREAGTERVSATYVGTRFGMRCESSDRSRRTFTVRIT